MKHSIAWPAWPREPRRSPLRRWSRLHPAQVDVRTGEIVRAPTDVPPPIGDREPTTINVELVTEERIAHLDGGTTFRYWTFNGTVPGPMIRARVGDTINVSRQKPARQPHGPQHRLPRRHGPGRRRRGVFAAPGETNTFSFKALNPGLYVYHCATAPVAQHIANGMYGMILVEPEGRPAARSTTNGT